jgi:hypothetical protein
VAFATRADRSLVEVALERAAALPVGWEDESLLSSFFVDFSLTEFWLFAIVELLRLMDAFVRIPGFVSELVHSAFGFSRSCCSATKLVLSDPEMFVLVSTIENNEVSN